MVANQKVRVVASGYLMNLTYANGKLPSETHKKSYPEVVFIFLLNGNLNHRNLRGIRHVCLRQLALEYFKDNVQGYRFDILYLWYKYYIY